MDHVTLFAVMTDDGIVNSNILAQKNAHSRDVRIHFD